jgi:hypothetical protein
MNLTYRQILSSKEAMESLLHTRPTPSLSVKIARNTRVMGYALEDFGKAKEVLVSAHRDKDGKFNREKLAPELVATLDAEYDKLLDTEVSVDIHPILNSELEESGRVHPDFLVEPWVIYDAQYMFEGGE